ncbi:LOW QUALITY PROTEIN: hypothetical protein YC2023_071717 [Brassica napus]
MELMQGATHPHTCRSACFDCMRRDISCLADPPRAPHGLLHVQDTCRTPQLLPDVRLHDWNSCKAPQHHTHGWPHASVPCAETPRAWSIHLVLLHVKLHVQLPCTSTPPPCVDTQLLIQNVLVKCIETPRASWSNRLISTIPVNFHPAINPKYFSTPFLMLRTILINST